jgi:spore coat protein U-like protein
VLGITGALVAATAAPSLANPGCVISNATALVYETSYDTNRPLVGRASFMITCSRTQTTIVAPLYSHRMKSAAKGPDLLYDLYATPGHSTIWGNGGDSGTVSQTFSAGRPTVEYIYARIPAHHQPSPGNFSDSVDIVTMP